MENIVMIMIKQFKKNQILALKGFDMLLNQTRPNQLLIARHPI